jgi:hypothetical protein
MRRHIFHKRKLFGEIEKDRVQPRPCKKTMDRLVRMDIEWALW